MSADHRLSRAAIRGSVFRDEWRWETASVVEPEMRLYVTQDSFASSSCHLCIGSMGLAVRAEVRTPRATTTTVRTDQLLRAA